MNNRLGWSIVAFCFALAGCQTARNPGSFAVPPVVGNTTAIAKRLMELPPPPQRLTVAVYDFPDLTGANKVNPTYADYSKAVTRRRVDGDQRLSLRRFRILVSGG